MGVPPESRANEGRGEGGFEVRGLPARAIENGTVHLIGDPELLTRFAEIFRIEPMPAARSI
jgi:hypothetical protein